MVAAAEFLTDLRQRRIRQLPRQVHRDLPGVDDVLRSLLAGELLHRQLESLRHELLDPADRHFDGVDFAIRVPRLDYFAAVKEGIGSGVLYASPGHYPSTRWPGDPGTVGVAAHNVYWINFPQLAKGDEIDLETRYGMFRYSVVSAEIVNPDNRTALVTDVNGYHLTLTTCWPLWAGAFATQRYVIHADQVWPVPLRPAYT